MLTPTFLRVIVITTSTLTATSAGRLERIENAIKSIDHKLHGYSNDIFTLKNDVDNTNRKLDLLLELINGTTIVDNTHTSNDIDTAMGNDMASDHLSTLNDLQATVKTEISRVRRAFTTEKNKLLQLQQRNNIQFLEFSNKLNDTLAILHDRHDTKWTLAAESINVSVVTVLGAVRDNIDHQLVQWNQTIHDNVNEQINITLATLKILNNQIVQWSQTIHDNVKEETNTTLATLKVLNNTIDTWSDLIHKSVNEVDVTFNDMINKSLIQHDNLTKTMQTKLLSSLTVINDTVRSMDYSDALSLIADSIHSNDNNTEILQKCRILTHDSVRLVNSTLWNEGRLEVYIDGQWGTVCDDEFNDIDASVVCKMLNYRTGVFRELAYFGQGTLPIVMDDVQCTGEENNIQECTHIKDNNCVHTEDVSVICYL